MPLYELTQHWGGTAVGTGLNCHEDFARLVIEFISQKTGINF